MDAFIARLDRAVWRITVVVMVALFIVLPLVANSDWSLVGVVKMVWGVGVTFLALLAAGFVVSAAIRWLFR